MDSVTKLNYYEQMSELAKTNKELKSQLLTLGIDLLDLPQDVYNLLDRCVEFKKNSMLCEIDENYINEYYHTKQKEQIDNRLIQFKMKTEIADLQNQIAKEEAHINVLENALSNTTIKSELEMKNIVAICEKKIQHLRQKQQTSKTESKINLDEIINKVNLLENKK